MVGKKAGSSRDTLVECGLTLMLQGSYERAGLQDILARAKLPKGSFYHHFRSKEDFGLAVIERYAEQGRERFRRHLLDSRVAPLRRVARLFEEMEKGLVAEGCKGGCLIGNMAQEQADVSEVFRSRMERLIAEQRELLAECFAEAQARKELDARLDPQAMAGFCLNSWQGALVQMKVSRSAEPLKQFRAIVFGQLLKA